MENIDPVATILRVILFSSDRYKSETLSGTNLANLVYIHTRTHNAANCSPVRSCFDDPIDISRYRRKKGRKEREREKKYRKIANRKWCNVYRKRGLVGSSWKIARVLACLAVSYLLLIQRISAIPRSVEEMQYLLPFARSTHGDVRKIFIIEIVERKEVKCAPTRLVRGSARAGRNYFSNKIYDTGESLLRNARPSVIVPTTTLNYLTTGSFRNDLSCSRDRRA